MATELSNLEQRVEELTAELVLLKQRVDHLTERVESPFSQELAAQAAPQPEAPQIRQTSAVLPEPGEVTEEILSWAGKAALLPRMATLCFLLVVALILRTITDSGLINTLVGSGLGMGYASILMLAGWHKYRQNSPLAPVIAGCGAVLISSIVVETHMHFQSLPIIPAYLTLMATGIAMAVVSYQHNAFTPISLGTLSMCLAGAAIDYPNPNFPYMSMILVTANILGYFAARLHRCSWLRWILLIVTLVMLHLWALRIGTSFYRKITPPPELTHQLFFPVLAILAATYLAIALLGILRSGTERISRFDFSLPTVNVTWTFTAAYYIVGAEGISMTLLGALGVAIAGVHLGIGYWLGGRGLERSPGSNSLVFAGSVLLALSLPVAFGSPLPAFALLSGFALCLVFFSSKWQSGGVRVTSYLLQMYSAGALAMTLFIRPPSTSPSTGAAVALIVTIVSFLHYRLCRQSMPPVVSEIFNRFDKRDRSAMTLLLSSLASGFFLLRGIAYQLIQYLPGEISNSFHCTQSAIINAAAIGLMAVAFKSRNKEVRNVAVLVTAIGAMKVFIYDLFGAHGLPLVISVFSFGLAAAFESVALGKWQGPPAKEADKVTENATPH